MNVSLHSMIRRTGVVLAVASVVAAIGAGSALAVDRPAASFYTKQQLQAMSQEWAAKARASLNRPAASFYTKQQLQAMSQEWAAKARASLNRPAVSFSTKQQVQAMSQGRAERARHDASLRSRDASPFDWGDFGIGAAAMLGLVLLSGGLLGGAYYGRKGGVRLRPVS
jgi:hypothetical protein